MSSTQRVRTDMPTSTLTDIGKSLPTKGKCNMIQLHDTDTVTWSGLFGYDFADSAADLFGHLVEAATSHGLMTFVSDLYHDASWIRENLTNDLRSLTFAFGVRASGTSIGHLDDEASIIYHNRVTWRFTIALDERGRCTITRTPVTLQQ